jgi:hypothetical protein
MTDKLTIEELLAFSVIPKKKGPVESPNVKPASFFSNFSFNGLHYSKQVLNFLNYEQVDLSVANITHFYGVTRLPVGPVIGLQVLHRHDGNVFCATPLGCHVRLNCRVQDTNLNDWWKNIWLPIYNNNEMGITWE